MSETKAPKCSVIRKAPLVWTGEEETPLSTDSETIAEAIKAVLSDDDTPKDE